MQTAKQRGHAPEESARALCQRDRLESRARRAGEQISAADAHNHSRAATIEHPARLAARSQSRRTSTAPTGDFPMKAVLLAATILVGANSAHAQVSAPQHANPTPSPVVATPRPAPVGVAAAPALRRPLHHRVRRSSPSIARVRTANREAIQEPQARAFVNAVQIYPFSDGPLYRLYAAPERVTDIALQAGQGVISVPARHTARWQGGGVAAAPALRRPLHHRVRRSSPSIARVRTANREAIQEPQARAFVNAVQIYPFSDGALYRLYAAPERVTDIALQAGEGVISVAAGDTARWTVGDTTSGSGEAKRVHILVKPYAAGLSTNLVITTDRRAYHLQLESTAATAMAAISWTYPQIGRAHV